MESVTLGSLCSPKQHPTVSLKELTPSGYPVFGANGQIGFFHSYTHDKSVIAITCRGATCGTVHVVPPFSYITGNAMALDDLDDEKVDIQYLAFALRARGFQDVISGSAQPQITRQALLPIRVSLPPIAEQRRIAQTLYRVAEVQQKRRNVLEKFGGLPKALYEEMFGRGSSTCVQLGTLLQDGDRINYGVVQPGPDTADGVPLIRVVNIANQDFSFGSLKRISPDIEGQYKRSRLNGHEILVACVGSVGAVALAEPFMAGMNIARAVARIPVDDRKANRVFLAEVLKLDSVQHYFKAETRTVAQPTLNIKQLGETLVPCPPLPLQSEFAQRVAMLRRTERKCREQEAVLGALFASVQNDAFPGVI